MPTSKQSLFELKIFKIALWSPIIVSTLLTIYIACTSNLEFAFGYSALNYALLKVFKIPLTILALIIPGVALVTANHRSIQSKKQIEISINHNILSVRPYLTATYSNTSSYLTYTIKNNGIGPAKITSTKLYWNDNQISPQEFKTELTPLLSSVVSDSPINLGELINSYMIAKDEEVTLIKIKFSSKVDKILIQKFGKVFSDSFKLKILYESIYEEENILIDNMDEY